MKTALDKCLDFIEDPRDVDVIWHTMKEGRAELATLRARVAELEAALEPLKKAADVFDDIKLVDDTDGLWVGSIKGDKVKITVGDCRMARTLLERK